MNKIPNKSKDKELPDAFELDKEIPDESELNTDQLTETEQVLIKPDSIPKLDIIPDESEKINIVPEASPEKEEKPSDLNEENCVVVNGQKIELKPTKLKYFRNKAASAYGIIKAVPLHELLTYGKGVLDEKRDADALLYDFLIAAFDDSVFVRNNYDELDADTIEKVVKIFGRINHIDEKEEAARKNKEAQAQAKR